VDDNAREKAKSISASNVNILLEIQDFNDISVRLANDDELARATDNIIRGSNLSFSF